MTEPQFSWTIPAPQPGAALRKKASLALWLIGAGLLANAAVLLLHGRTPELTLDSAAFGQAAGASNNGGQMLGARGIYMMPAQLGPSAFGLYLMDIDSGTICVYKANPDTSRFRLMAARSFKYDRFYEDFNNEAPLPKDVQKLIENQRQRQELLQKQEQPTVDQNPRPDPNLPDGAANGGGAAAGNP